MRADKTRSDNPLLEDGLVPSTSNGTANSSLRTRDPRPKELSVSTKHAGGRPRKSDEDRTVVATVRLTRARKAKLQSLGAEWLSELLDKTPSPNPAD